MSNNLSFTCVCNLSHLDVYLQPLILLLLLIIMPSPLAFVVTLCTAFILRCVSIHIQIKVISIWIVRLNCRISGHSKTIPEQVAVFAESKRLRSDKRSTHGDYLFALPDTIVRLSTKFLGSFG